MDVIKSLQSLKNVVDAAIQRGLFKDSETVVQTHAHFENVKKFVLEKQQPAKAVPGPAGEKKSEEPESSGESQSM